MTNAVKATSGPGSESAPAPSDTWRLSIRIPGVPDIDFRHPSRDAAISAAMTIVEKGVLVQDRSKDASNYNAVIYPVSQIQSMHVYEKK